MTSTRGFVRLLGVLAASLALLAAACSDDDDASSSDDTTNSDETTAGETTGEDVAADDEVAQIDVGDGEYEATLRVQRAIPIDDEGDGAGVVRVTLATDCRNDRGNEVPVLATWTSDTEVDLSADDATVEPVFVGLADGTYFGSAWLDDVDNPEQEEDFPATGDLVMFGDLSPRCVEFNVAGGDATVDLDLDYVMPFTLPGLEADAGIIAEEQPPTDPATITDDGSTHTVTMMITRSVEPDLGGDGVGPWFAGLSEACFDDETGEVPIPQFPVLLDEVALPESDSEVEIVIEDVPNGVYYFNGFIDDAGEGSSEPRPGIGDLVSFGGFGPACTEVVVNGDDTTAVFDLNLVLPFDL